MSEVVMKSKITKPSGGAAALIAEAKARTAGQVLTDAAIADIVEAAKHNMTAPRHQRVHADQMAKWLRDKHSLSVTRATLDRWCLAKFDAPFGSIKVTA